MPQKTQKKHRKNLDGNLFMVSDILHFWNKFNFKGDVFRPPKAGMLLSVLAGVGLQVRRFSIDAIKIF